MTFDVNLRLPEVSELLRDMELQPGSTVQKFIDSEIISASSPYVPFDTGMLDKSPIVSTVIGSGIIVYATPYAERLYNHPEYNFSPAHHPLAGAGWVERAWAERGDEIIAGAERLVKTK